MGYYTKFKLTIKEGNDFTTDYEGEIKKEVDYICLFEEECKWYSWEEEMKKYSLNHPNVVFLLSGEGEEVGDLWKAYFKNGEVQICKAIITYNEFNLNELK